MINPYRETNEAGMANTEGYGPRQVYHREAHGFTGEMLDAILREQFSTGVSIGHREAWDEARPQIQQAAAAGWDEGAVAGQSEVLERARTWYGAAAHADGPLTELSELVDGSQLSREKKRLVNEIILSIERAFEAIIDPETVNQ